MMGMVMLNNASLQNSLVQRLKVEMTAMTMNRVLYPMALRSVMGSSITVQMVVLFLLLNMTTMGMDLLNVNL